MATITITSGSWAVDATLTIGVGVPGTDGVGVPVGGVTGQVLAKASATNYDTEWVNVDDVAAVWGQISGTITDQGDLITYVADQLAGGTAVAKNLEIEVRNQTGATLDAGAIVYISGATGNKATVSKAIATGDATSAQTLGFVKEAITNNATGKVVVRGTIENLDTSALAEGQQLYLSGTTAGTWQTTKPTAPVHLVYVGIVTRSHPTLGTIEVAIQNGAEIGELHDVAITSPVNGQVLKYDSATDLWINGAITSFGAVTFSGKISTTTGSTAPINFNPATTPTTQVAGDVWMGTNTLFIRGSDNVNRGLATVASTQTFTQPQTIQVANANPSLTLTQSGAGGGIRINNTGAGACIVVDDGSPVPDTTAFIVTNSGRVGIGRAPGGQGSISYDLDVGDTTGAAQDGTVLAKTYFVSDGGGLYFNEQSAGYGTTNFTIIGFDNSNNLLIFRINGTEYAIGVSSYP